LKGVPKSKKKKRHGQTEGKKRQGSGGVIAAAIWGNVPEPEGKECWGSPQRPFNGRSDPVEPFFVGRHHLDDFLKSVRDGNGWQAPKR